MSTGCITSSDIQKLRDLVAEVKSNLYDWISEKQNTNELFDSPAAGLNTNMAAGISLGGFKIETTSSTMTADPDGLETFGAILGL